jgi:predicted ATPase
LTRLAEAISGKDLLLILDNCEHLIGTAATVADELLRSAPGLRLLATSREPLGIAGERLFPVEPLALPPADVGAGTAPTFPAMRLLMDRATGFTLDDDTVGPAARIVRALDGMPLAIELAAARLRTLPIAVLADRLADRFRLLTGGSRTALPRHQTLRAVVDWSWDLLTEPERALWRRFAVFAGGADVTAVENVCDADIDLLGALVDKSLLVLAPDGRYRMLETIREYGRERLAEAGEEEKARLALAGYLLDLAGRAEPELRGADQLMWLRRLTDEHDNFHAALRAAIDGGNAAVACAMTARLGWYWWLRGHRVEGASLAGEVIDLGGEPDPADLAVTYCFHALNGLEGASSIEEVKDSFRAAERLSHLSDHPVLRMVRPLAAIYELRSEVHGFELTRPLFDDPDPWIRAAARMITAQLLQNYGHSGELAMTEMQEALDAFRAIGERWGTGFTLSSLGDMAAARGDFAQAVDYQREAIALVREVGIREDLPQLEVKLAHQLWLAGEHAEARRMLKQAKATAEDIGLAEVMASVIYGAATNARLEGSLDEARDLMAQAAESIANSAFGPQFWAISRSTQGLIEAEAGDLAAARAFHTEAIEVAMASNDSPVIAMVLVGVADLALRGGDPAEAARLLGAADAVRGSIDRSVPDVDRIEAAARAALGDAGFSDAYAKGSGVTAASALGASGLKPAA